MILPLLENVREQLIRNLVRITHAIGKLQKSPYSQLSFAPLEDDIVKRFESAISSHSQTWAVIDLFVIDQEIIFVLITCSNITLHRSKMTLSQVRELQKLYLESINDFNDLFSKFKNDIIDNINERIIDVEHIYIIPFDDLHAIPWESVFENKSVSRSYNLNMLYLLLQHKNVSSDEKKLGLIVCPDSALNEITQKEIDFVSGIFEKLGFQLVKLLNNNATKENTINYLEKSQIAHIICHANFDPYTPLNSSFMLSEEEVFASEIYNLTNGPDVLFINACGAGKSNNMSHIGLVYDNAIDRIAIRNTPISSFSSTKVYDEQIGIVSSFFASGSRSIIAPISTITVYDAYEAANIIYTILCNGKSIGDAIKEVSTKRLEYNVPAIGYALYGNPYYMV
jgi:CHAT domain-containing protein